MVDKVKGKERRDSVRVEHASWRTQGGRRTPPTNLIRLAWQLTLHQISTEVNIYSGKKVPRTLFYSSGYGYVQHRKGVDRKREKGE